MTVHAELDGSVVVLDRAKPDQAETSMLIRVRPGWSEFVDVLLARFNPNGYVFTAAPLNVFYPYSQIGASHSLTSAQQIPSS